MKNANWDTAKILQFGVNEWFSPPFQLPALKTNQLAMHGIYTVPPGYGAGGQGAGA